MLGMRSFAFGKLVVPSSTYLDNIVAFLDKDGEGGAGQGGASDFLALH